MTVYLQYVSSYASTKVADYLSAWATAAGSGSTATGAFYPGTMNGSEYAIKPSTATGFVGTGSLYMTNWGTKVLYGTLDTVEMGENFNKTASGFVMQPSQVNFVNLGVSSSVGSGVNGEVHKLLYSGLRQGNVSEMSSLLQTLLASAVTAYNTANGTSLTFADMTFAQFLSVGAASTL